MLILLSLVKVASPRFGDASDFTTMVGGSQESGMPMLVGYIFGGLTLFYWQRLRQLAGRPFRRCFLDKVCIPREPNKGW